MDRNTVKSYLEKSLKQSRYTHQGLKYNCPKCDSGNKYNLEINLDKNSKKNLLFNCWACHYKGHLRKLFTDYSESKNWQSIKELYSFLNTHPPEGTILAVKELPKTIPYYLSTDISYYLKKTRNLSELMLLERKVLFCYVEGEELYNKIIFPYYEDGLLIGYSSQDFQTKKYKNHRSLNFVAYKDFINVNYPIIITEGIYDCFSVPNAIPMLGTAPGEELLKFGQNKNIVLALDNDVSLNDKKEIGEKFYFYGANQVAILGLDDYKDLNDWRVKDKEGLQKEIKNVFRMLNEKG